MLISAKVAVLMASCDGAEFLKVVQAMSLAKTDEEAEAACLYFRGQGPKPSFMENL